MMVTAAKRIPKTDKAVGDTATLEEISTQGADVERRTTVATDHQTGNQAAFVGSEPLKGRRGGGRIADAHTDATEDTKTNDQAGIALHHTGNDAADSQEKTTGDGANLGAELVLNAAAGNHQQRKDDYAQ